jgi:maltose alpha-D-glucosyltransferase/alpha-amylase
VLCTGSGFVIIDFEGEPARSLEARRMKHPAVLDVAGMVRSFHYAGFAYLEGKLANMPVASREWPEHRESWAQFWCDWTATAFLKSYLRIMAHSQVWPAAQDEARCLFEAYLLEKATYELNYELNNRPDWVEIPLRGIMQILEPADSVETDQRS